MATYRGPKPAGWAKLCENCNFNEQDRDCSNYKSHLQLIRTTSSRGTWKIGSEWFLKERPKLYFHGELLENQDVVMTKFVRENTSIPVASEMIAFDDDESWFVLVKRVPGVTLGSIWWDITKEEQEVYIREVGEYLKELRKFTSPVPCSIEGKPLRDTIFVDDDSRSRVYSSAEEWAVIFRDWAEGHKLDWKSKIDQFVAEFPSPEPYVLTHGDLDASNIMVHNGHVSGIIDWEYAGYYPVWWEYVKIGCSWAESEAFAPYIGDFKSARRFVKRFARKFCNPEYYIVEDEGCWSFKPVPEGVLKSWKQ
jgi:aminoglycoside phosphotransferase